MQDSRREERVKTLAEIARNLPSIVRIDSVRGVRSGVAASPGICTNPSVSGPANEAPGRLESEQRLVTPDWMR